MSKEGVLTIRMFDAPEGSDTQIVKPSDPYYEETLEYVGEVRNGERKALVRSIGQVHMEADRSISYSLYTIESSGPQARIAGKAKPGDESYESMLTRVGGLSPGETKMIPAK